MSLKKSKSGKPTRNTVKEKEERGEQKADVENRIFRGSSSLQRKILKIIFSESVHKLVQSVVDGGFSTANIRAENVLLLLS
jgi:hypothetical protein